MEGRETNFWPGTFDRTRLLNTLGRTFSKYATHQQALSYEAILQMTATTFAPEQYFTVQVTYIFLIFLQQKIGNKLYCLELHNFLPQLSVSDWIPWLKFEYYKAK